MNDFFCGILNVSGFVRFASSLITLLGTWNITKRLHFKWILIDDNERNFIALISFRIEQSLKLHYMSLQLSFYFAAPGWYSCLNPFKSLSNIKLTSIV